MSNKTVKTAQGRLEPHGKFIFEKMAEGLSYTKIADLLRERGVRTARSNVHEWVQRRIRKVTARRHLLAPVLTPIHMSSVKPEVAEPVLPDSAVVCDPLNSEPSPDQMLPTVSMTVGEMDAKFAELMKLADASTRFVLPRKQVRTYIPTPTAEAPKAERTLLVLPKTIEELDAKMAEIMEVAEMYRRHLLAPVQPIAVKPTVAFNPWDISV